MELKTTDHKALKAKTQPPTENNTIMVESERGKGDEEKRMEGRGM